MLEPPVQGLELPISSIPVLLVRPEALAKDHEDGPGILCGPFVVGSQWAIHLETPLDSMALWTMPLGH